MDTSILKAYLNNVTPISQSEWDDFEQYFSASKILKNEFLWKEGDICNHLVFVNNGKIYCYFNKEGVELVSNFYFDNAIFYDDYSFIGRQPSSLNYRALEDTEMIVIPRVGLNTMFDKYKSFERLGRMIIERQHINSLKDQLNSQKLSSAEKYSMLLQRQPEIIERVPLKLIASYLGVTPEHLSRLRKVHLTSIT